ncbi:MAG: PAS domain S-box protein [Desulfobulbaceae bacterium]|nr:PAS domain S-box protein [Desulfobulbaceae bacterium]
MSPFDNFVKENQKQPLILADDNGIITDLNDKFCDSYEWERDQLIGRPITAIIPTALHDAHHIGLSNYLVSGHPRILKQPLPLQLMTGSGKTITAEHYIISELSNGKYRFAATIKAI